jgi:hypothetical protein
VGKKISDNPTAAEMMQAAEAARLIASLGVVPPHGPLAEAAKALADVVDKAGVLTLPDRFNKSFAGLGWITCGSMPTSVMETAIDLKKAGRSNDAEQALAEIFDEPAAQVFDHAVSPLPQGFQTHIATRRGQGTVSRWPLSRRHAPRADGLRWPRL